MSRYYVDVLNGNDSTGDGSIESPFKTLTHACSESVLTHGDEILVEASSGGDVVYSDDTGTVKISGLTNITIRFLSNEGEDFGDVIWKPSNVSNDLRATLFIENCNDVTISGGRFSSTDNHGRDIKHIHAVKAVNSSIKVVNCKIEPDWKTDISDTDNPPVDEGSLFCFSNCDAVISGVRVERLNNSFNMDYSVIAVSGTTEYEITSTYIANVTSNNYKFRGIHVLPGTRKVSIDGALIHGIQGDLAGSAIGIDIDGEGSGSSTDFILNSCQLSNCQTGIQITHLTPSYKYNRRIQRSTFYKCIDAVKVIGSQVEVYSISAYAGSYEKELKDELNQPVLYGTSGVHAFESSTVRCINSIFTSMQYSVVAESGSTVTLEHIVWNDCEYVRNELTEGTVNVLQFIRRTDPMYLDLHADPWGYFAVKDSSPCINTGKNYGEPFMGSAPDIGALEREESSLTSIASYMARAARYSEYIPMTEIDVEGMITQGLNTADTDLKAGREGSVIKDFAVKPLEGLLYPFVAELEFIRKNMSFLNFMDLDEEAADALAANVFVYRTPSNRASGSVRIYFSDTSDVSIPAEFVFSTNTGLKYYAVQTVNITAEEMSLNYENGLYYMDVLIEAKEPGYRYNTEANTINRNDIALPANAVSVTNPLPIEGGKNAETNKELYEKIHNSITSRDLVTAKGINYVLRDTFGSIDAMQVIGYGDPEMIRDTVLDDETHIGGKVDIYMKMSTNTNDSFIFDPIHAENVLDQGSFSKLPLLKINSMEILDPETMDTTGSYIPVNKYKLESVSRKTRFSIYEKLILSVSPEYVGYTIKMNFSWAEDIKTIQSWITSDANRVVCADLYAKHMCPVYISFAVFYYGPYVREDMTSALETFVQLKASDEPLQASDIVDYVYSLGVAHVVTPFTISAEIHHSDGKITRLEDQDEISIDRTYCYLPGDIYTTYMGYEPPSI